MNNIQDALTETSNSVRRQGKTLLSGYGMEDTIIIVQLSDLIAEINKNGDRLLAERILQGLGVNYDAG